MMLALTLSCIRLGTQDEFTRLVARGQLAEAVRLGMARLERKPPAARAAEHSGIGQVVGRCLIALGREEEAEELFRRQLRVYELGSRAYVRWLSSLDQGVMQLALNRPSRAAVAFNGVADDEAVPPTLRIEALAGLAVSLRAVGEYRRAERTLVYAQTLADNEVPLAAQRVLQALHLENCVLQKLRTFEEERDISRTAPLAPEELHRRLSSAATALDDMPAAQTHLRFLAALAAPHPRGADYARPILEHVAALRQHKVLGEEKACRIAGALAMVAHGEVQPAQALLGGLSYD